MKTFITAAIMAASAAEKQKNCEGFLTRMKIQEQRFEAAGINCREIK